jgi:hypothetical protein
MRGSFVIEKRGVAYNWVPIVFYVVCPVFIIDKISSKYSIDIFLSLEAAFESDPLVNICAGPQPGIA